MSLRQLHPDLGHVFRRQGRRGGVWYAKYRLPDGRQIQRRIGPAWAQRGRPGAGFYTRRTAQAWLDQASLRRASLRSLRFHDLRHTFGTQVISNPAVSILQLKVWMGHAEIDTTMNSLHYAPRAGEAELVADAFAPPTLHATAPAESI
jgi:integrase